ncbi:TIGR03943 family putative permease subunit [Fictibacillus terranigra]|uniref:TIGR03943 family protein n=1 Tax=Fictibacillus terranigra TaxID=3058424 RepID=A0ABT8E7F5_9BACL|nr:TIGR03943 family protein [Fictibacillus sp. CENA-BCM004]MDN4073804.1 TIGR03943 family protein [Fictibacillus sp. CENA-BCM004]
MIRGYLLMGFTFLIMQLHASGNISKYINMKYSYLSFSVMFALALLTIVQFRNAVKNDGKTDSCDCCDHSHSVEDTWYKKLFVYSIFAFPVITGIFLPVATMDSNIVKAKGFHFPVNQESKGDPYAQNQFLRPDTSVYYGKDAYDKLMRKEKKKYSNYDTLALNDTNYLKGMETIYNYPGDFDDKNISFKGFVYNDPDTKKNQLFVFRFGIIHCVADSGVFGMMVEMPNGVKLKNDEWITVKGKISEIYYQPFKTNIPYVKVDSWSKTNAPKEQYVYRGNN